MYSVLYQADTLSTHSVSCKCDHDRLSASRKKNKKKYITCTMKQNKIIKMILQKEIHLQVYSYLNNLKISRMARQQTGKVCGLSGRKDTGAPMNMGG